MTAQLDRADGGPERVNDFSPSPAVHPPGPGVNILLVDDQPANLLALRAILDDLGQNLVEARSGGEALRRLLADDFAVILLDVQMQGLDGFETARLIRGRDRSRRTPIIFLTAHEGDRPSIERAYTLGAVDYLVKPLAPVILRAKVAGFVELFEKTEQVRRQAELLRQMESREYQRRLAEENAALQEQLRLAAFGRDVGLALVQHDSLAGMLQAACAAMVKHPDAAFARIWTLNQAEGVLELRASAGLYTHLDGPHSRILLGQYKIGLIARERKPLLTNSVQDDPRVSQGWARREGMVAFAGYPLVVEGRLVGVMALFARHPLSEAALQAMAAVADAIASAVERKQAQEALRRAHEELEKRVRERTADLAAANEALHQEVRERREAQERVQAFATELQRSNRELEQFASVASHDLQEPLRKVQAFGDRLKAHCGPALGEQGREYLERMRAAAARMSTLIHDLLTFSRVTTKAQPFASVDLAQEARRVVSDLEGRLEQTCGRVELGWLPSLHADPTQMRQLLQNLIGNGLKFHKPGVPPVVKVAGKVLDGQTWEVTVQDNGIGFEEVYLDRIFQLFQRLHGRTEYEGTGIGLAICRKIVERHGGTITARSAPGQGATFIVTLPLRAAAAASEVSASGGR